MIRLNKLDYFESYHGQSKNFRIIAQILKLFADLVYLKQEDYLELCKTYKTKCHENDKSFSIYNLRDILTE